MRRSAPFVLALALGLACNPPASAPWEIVAQGLPEAVLSIGGTSSSNVWAVGADETAGPIVLHYDGTGWTRVPTGTRGTLWWVHAFGDGTLYLGGAGATILRSTDGVTFARMRVPGLAAHTVFGIWGSAPNDAYAVGSVSGRDGFVWHFDGTSWTAVALPTGLPVDALGDTAGLFKVWGDGAGHVYVVGGRGVLLRSTGGAPFELLPTGTMATLFTVSGDATHAVVVGGLSTGVILEVPHDAMPVDVSPAGTQLVQGVSVRDGHAFASGAMGTIYERASAWSSIDTMLSLDIASLHATWIDPDGGVWAVGGNVLTTDLDHGAIVHRGAHVPTYPTSVTLDGGVDAGPPPATCPMDQIDPVPTGTIARRWNEQIIGAIRRDVPRPGVHARNLYHLSAAIWDAWATFDTRADGVFFTERNTASDVDAARTEAMSYAAYRILTHRYEHQTGGAVSTACFTSFMGTTLGYDVTNTDATGTMPSAIGNRIAATVIAATMEDGANEANNYADTTSWMATNPPLVVDLPGTTLPDPSHWQQLNLALAETQNGIIQTAGVQTYVGAQWGAVTPFAMTRPGPGMPYHPADPAPVYGTSEMREIVADILHRASTLDHTDGVMIDISPGAYGNNTLGQDDGHGRAMNPITGAPYAVNSVPMGDFGRVLAEFWADGPRSETPPGHWFTIANAVSDSPSCTHQFEGTGTALDRLEWDVRIHLAVGGAVHDAAITAWELKRVDTTVRPISLVRAMGALGQGSDPTGDHYDPNGLALVPGEVELVTEASCAAGERHAGLCNYVGQIVVRSWRGEPGDRAHEVGGVGWIRAIDWIPYQRRTFVTPAFPGYVSGHSTFSRAAAEVLAAFTGSDFFPGGMATFQANAHHYLVFEEGPSSDVQLQWATYFDAADQAGQSRIFGGIHLLPDDHVGRRLGSEVGLDAYAHARTYFDGSARP